MYPARSRATPILIRRILACMSGLSFWPEFYVNDVEKRINVLNYFSWRPSRLSLVLRESPGRLQRQRRVEDGRAYRSELRSKTPASKCFSNIALYASPRAATR